MAEGKQSDNGQEEYRNEERCCTVCGRKLGLLTPRGQIEGKWYCKNCGKDVVWHCAMCGQEKTGIALSNKGESSFCSIGCAVKYRQTKGSESKPDKKALQVAEEGRDRFREADRESWLNQLREGTINIEVIGGESPIILKPQEQLRVVLPRISLLEPRAVTEGGGFYGGPTIRVAKGLSFRLGAAAGRSESHEELRNVDQGVLTLTNRRLVFSGKKRTLNIGLMSIVSMEPFKDALAVRREGREKTQYFSGADPKTISMRAKVDDREYEEPFTWAILQYLIEGTIKQRAALPGEKEAKSKPMSARGESIPDQIKKLAELRDAGVLTSEEFECKKTELLKRM